MFKFTVVASFQDPLTRQIAESVRIERGGASILNSRAEYSRCCVPRLMIDMEGWRKGTKEVTATVQEDAVEIAIMTQEDDQQKRAFADMESSSRRLDLKRKAEELKGRKAKKRKLPKLK